jgi:hypothetical protein
MPTFMTFLLRLFLVAAGLLFAASLGVGALLMLAVWGGRAGWARLTGRPVTPFIMRLHPRGGFNRRYRRPEPAGRAPRAATVRSRGRVGDVTDVEAK